MDDPTKGWINRKWQGDAILMTVPFTNNLLPRCTKYKSCLPWNHARLTTWYTDITCLRRHLHLWYLNSNEFHFPSISISITDILIDFAVDHKIEKNIHVWMTFNAPAKKYVEVDIFNWFFQETAKSQMQSAWTSNWKHSRHSGKTISSFSNRSHARRLHDPKSNFRRTLLIINPWCNIRNT